MKSRAILLLFSLMITSSLVLGQTKKDTVRQDTVHQHFTGFITSEQSWKLSKEAYAKQLKAMGYSDKEIKEKVGELEKRKVVFMKRIKVQMESAEKQMQLAEMQRKMAEKQMQQFHKQWDSVKFKKKIADVQKKMVIVQKRLADKRLKMAAEWGRSIHRLMDEDITLEGKNSRTKSVKLKVTQPTNLFFNISCSIRSGSVSIEIFNPKGQKAGELSLEHSKGAASGNDTGFSGHTSGSLNKMIHDPEIGEWVIKMKPRRSKGQIHISATQFTKPSH